MEKVNDLIGLQDTLYRSSNPTRRWLHCARRDWINEALHRYMPDNPEHAMEVGPGSGIYLPLLADLYLEVSAVDIEEAYLDNARERMADIANLHIQTDDITSSKMSDEKFDFILCTEVIEHISDSKNALINMYRLLKPGGILLLSTPQRYSPLEVFAKIAFLPGIIRLVRLVYQEPILETGHINLLTESELRRQLEDAGFVVIENYKTGLYIPLVAEFMGELGLKIEQAFERNIMNSSFDWLLWTQYYVLKKQ